MASKATNDITKQVLLAWDNVVRPHVERHTVPIWAARRKDRFLCGTGTLFAVADEHFIVTAGHVADREENRNCQLYVSDNSPAGSKAFLLDGAVHLATNDGYDVSLMVLSPQQVDQLAHHSFLRLSDVDLAPDLVDGAVYYLCGYPGEWNAVPEAGGELQPEGIFHRLQLAPTARDYSSLRGYMANVHVLLDYSGGATDENGLVVALPDWHGISGCAIWRAWQPGEKPYPPDLNKVKIIAVETAIYTSSKVIRGTRWGVVLELLIRTCPSLRRPIEIHTGPLPMD